ncbi:MAG TPA: alpha-hydroxy acid oxidase [Ktedonobacterales bacterium]|nr:alpha-hydroxy acid oxidase [Ktedonobacterales bacterium]
MTEWVNLLELEALARQRMTPMAFDYYAGGAEDEVTLRENRAAFARIALRPRVLVDVSVIDTGATALGQPVAAPILVAPTAMHRLGHPEGELATVRGAGAAETLMVVSTLATTSLEDVAAAAGGPLWFQLYAVKDREITRALVERARAAGYQALCVTVDTPHSGRRERDVRNRFALPPGIELANFSGPEMRMMPQQGSGSALTTYVMKLMDVILTWDDIAWLQSFAGMPILLKGILTAEDARLAVEHGAAGIIVSNHGGRQLDTAVASIRALPEVVEAAAGRAEVYLDGGVRRGTDVLKALALGARAVLIGRPILWGLTLDGADGVARVLRMLRHELEEAMVLAGRPTLASIDRSLLYP